MTRKVPDVLESVTMPAFTDLDWTRFDVWAVVATEGVVVVKPAHREACQAWLKQHDYTVTSIDFTRGIGPAVIALGELFRWEEQFGYRLTQENCNLNALRDGFDFNMRPAEGQVLELLSAEVAYRDDPEWLFGLLAIAHEYSLRQLALGARFFMMLLLEDGNPLSGVQYETLSVPGPYWTAATHDDPFLVGDRSISIIDPKPDAGEKQLLDNTLDALDSLFDRNLSVVALWALLFATAKALQGTPHCAVLTGAVAGLLSIVRSGENNEKQVDRALEVTNELRHYLADLLPLE